MALELKVLENTQGSLVINYEEFKQELSLAIEGYKDLVIVEKIDEKIYTPNGVNQNGIALYINNDDGKEYKVVTFVEAKNVRAKLNSAIKKISDRRIELKKEFLKPYEMVEAQAKELESIIKNIGAIYKDNTFSILKTESALIKACIITPGIMDLLL